MRIDGITLRELHLPLVRPFETSFGVTSERRILLAEVRSEGLIGWGECTAGDGFVNAPQKPRQRDTLALCLEVPYGIFERGLGHLIPAHLAKDSRAVPAVFRRFGCQHRPQLIHKNLPG